MAGGQGLTSGQGSVTQSADVALSGGAVTSATGTIVYSEQIEDALTGSGSTAAAGTAAGSRIIQLKSRKVGGGSSTRALSGQAMSHSTGAISVVPQLTPTGILFSGGLGAFGKSRTINQVGASISALQGGVGAPSGSLGPLASDFQITSSSGGADVPFSLGYAFRQGDVPSGQIATTADASSWQCTVKNSWPDGSVKFAVLAGSKTLTAGVPATITLTAAASGGGAALSITDLKAQLTQPVAFGAGAFGSASWSGTDWDTPFVTWVSGPVMSSWVYRKQIGADAHLVGWLEVRLYASGAVEVLPWIENGYLTVASPTNKSATYTFTLGGTQRFSASIDLLNHQRTPLVSGSVVSYWLGTDPDTTIKHNSAYLQSTRMVPYYSASVSTGASVVTSQPTTYTPLQQGSHPAGIGAGGYSPSIGLLPEWEVLYLTCPLASLWKSVQFNAYSAGRYGIHFRDESTNRPLRFSLRPTLTLSSSGNYGIGNTPGGSNTTPNATGGTPPNYVVTHHPAMGYFAYLLTGRMYHLETAQFVATLNYLNQSVANRNNSAGIMLSSGGQSLPRGAAWGTRSLAMAAAITPDGDVLRTEFINSLESNVNFYHGKYVASTSNPFGWVEPYWETSFGGPYAQIINGTTGGGSTSTAVVVPFGDGVYDDTHTNWTLTIGGETREVVDYVASTKTATVFPAFSVSTAGVAYTLRPNAFFDAPWMQDFFLAAYGLWRSLDLGHSDTIKEKLREFFNWKSQAVVGRLQGAGATEYLYRDAGAYCLAIAPTDAPDWNTGAGPWFANWGEVWAASHLFPGDKRNDGANGKHRVDGDLRGPSPSRIGEFPDITTPWGELQPALAYAVEHGAPGALTAWARMTRASNWSSAQAQFNNDPVWSVKPPPSLTTTPAWAVGQAADTWREIAGSNPYLLVPTNVPLRTDGLAGGPRENRLNAWCGLSIDTRTSSLWALANGGHGDYFGNEVMSIDLLADAPLWREVLAGSSGLVVNVGSAAQYTDGMPASRHSYYGQQIIERHDRAISIGGSLSGGGGAVPDDIASFRITTRTHDAYDDDTQDPPYGYSINGTTQAISVALGWCACKHPLTEDVYIVHSNIYRKRPVKTGIGFTQVTLAGPQFLDAYIGHEGATAIDTTRNRMFWFRGAGLYQGPVTYDLDTGVATLHTFQASAAQASLDATGNNYNPVGAAFGVDYVSSQDAYYIRGHAAGGRLWKVNAGTWEVEEVPTTGGSAIVAGAGDATGPQKVYNKIRYVPALNGLVYFASGNSNGFFYKLGGTNKYVYSIDFSRLSTQDPLSIANTWSNNTKGRGGNGAPTTGTSVRIVAGTGGGPNVAAGSAAHQINYEDSFAFQPLVVEAWKNYRVIATVWRAAGYSPTDNHEIEIIIGCKTSASYHRWIECLWSVQGNQETINQDGDFTGTAFTLFGSSTGLLSGGPLDGDKMVAEYYPSANRIRWGRIRAGVTVWAQDTTNATYINGTLGNGIGIAVFRRSISAFDTVAASFGFRDILIEVI